ncbi:hypothetical protein JTB14_026137 [Gonioctena quinquepunctata]|nr:hypothetical protein JTB14_026137 [Gonioctena quinquepunctata]
MSDPKPYDDILVDIPDESLEELADIYEKKCTNIPYASSLLRNGKRLRDKGVFYITFMSPGDSWKKDGTFFALMEFPGKYHLTVFTLSESANNIYESLMKTKRIHFDGLVFYALHNSLYQTILRIIGEKKLKTVKTNPNYIYTMPKEVAMDFQLELPPEVKLAKLEVSHSNLVSSHWPHRFPRCEEYIAAFIENNGGFGLFLKSTNELIAWVLKTGVGKIGVLETVEAHRKKGYASILTKTLSKEIALEGENPTTNVLDTNIASMKLMEKLGFRNVGLCYYITLAGN